MNNQMSMSQVAEEVLRRSLIDFSLKTKNGSMFEALHDGTYEVVKSKSKEDVLSLKTEQKVVVDARTGKVRDSEERLLDKLHEHPRIDELYSLAKLLYKNTKNIYDAHSIVNDMYNKGDIGSFGDYSVVFTLLKRLYKYAE